LIYQTDSTVETATATAAVIERGLIDDIEVDEE
jgi:hypothetical protein